MMIDPVDSSDRTASFDRKVMIMSQTSLIQQIEQLDSLTPSEAKIADYFSRHYDELVFDNVSTISDKTGVSKATVVRFISKLGYSKFAEFLNEIRKNSHMTHDSLHIRYPIKMKLLKEQQEDILAQNFTQIIKNLEKTHGQMDQQSFLKAAQWIATSKGKLYITGQRSSYALAYLFHNMIQRICPGCFLIDPQGAALPDFMMDIQETDILFAIFRHPYARQTFSIAEHFAAEGAKVILLTDSDFTPLGQVADLKIVIKTEGVSIFTSSAAIVAVLESLNIAVLKYLEGDVSDRLFKSEKLYERFDIFCGKSHISDPGALDKEIKKYQKS